MNAPLKKEEDHAYQNAQAWAGSISQMVCALECDYGRLEELRERGEYFDNEIEELAELEAACTIDGDKMENPDRARERIQESPLSVEVRSGWHNPGDASDEWEFRILLTTGGPALQIRGELDQYMQPRRAWLEYQDWGTPWTEYHGEGCSNDDLLAFCRQFFFGE